MRVRDTPADEHFGPRPAPGQEGVTAHAHPDDDALVFDAILTPHRSLSKRGFTLLMTSVCIVSFTAGLGFFLMGAWPVVGFMGLDVLLIYGAFKLNFRAARLYETVTLTRDDLTVRRVSPRGDSQIWRFQPAWLQVRMDDPPEHDSQLILRSHGRQLAIGSFLTAEERLDLAKTLQDAVVQANAPGPPTGPEVGDGS
ncbi:DUF2244 domain-containing protein [Rhodovibrio salinarum]|uniref:DUF2244 domain-containing protein n=1 Tax=Rhodovibrio salinarum TaxID=1087 RepID=A0A934QH61_9PROT|nr:DUF2244 domain-containing protein [Rhodovibrio salinarum]MBK1696921.1 DUF2244 domain-containing protein [Rhodovibrio salinarum]